MQNDLTSKIPFRENIKNIKDLMSCTYYIDKLHYYLAAFIHLLNAVNANLSLIITAVVLDGLYAGNSMKEIVGKAALLLCISFLLRMAASILWNEVMQPRRENVKRVYDGNLAAKYQNMDFSLIDSPYVKKLSERIEKDNNWGAGLYNLFWDFDAIVYGIMNMLCSLAVAFPVIKIIAVSKNPWMYSGIAALGLILFVLTKVTAKCSAAYNEELLKDWEDRFPSKEHLKKYADFTWQWVWRAVSGDYHYIKEIHLYDGYDLMKKYTKENREESNKIVPWYKTIGGKSGRLGALSGANGSLLTVAGYLIAFVYAIAGAFSPGSVIKYAGCITNVFGGVQNLKFQYDSLCLTARKHASTLKMLSVSDEMYKGKLPVEKRRDNKYEIEFCNVSFRYPGTEQYALKNFSLKLRIGERMAIVGMNGSGKTTMIKLLCRLYDPQEGEILLNGVDIRKFKQEEYIKLFSVVFQDFKLLSMPLGQNVAAAMDYDANLVTECLERAGLGERLKQLPNGLETCLYKDISDDGVEISGGEAQKIALARALYKDAPFVLLDEPTASLDPISEFEIYSGFDAMVGTKTAIYISHRLSSCRFCDDIAVFHKGQLVQRGSHEELLKDEQGKYYELWHAQAQYYD